MTAPGRVPVISRNSPATEVRPPRRGLWQRAETTADLPATHPSPPKGCPTPFWLPLRPTFAEAQMSRVSEVAPTGAPVFSRKTISEWLCNPLQMGFSVGSTIYPPATHPSLLKWCRTPFLLPDTFSSSLPPAYSATFLLILSSSVVDP